MNWEPASDIQKEVNWLIENLEYHHLRKDYIFCFRSFGSVSRAIARIWALPRIWQQALNVPPAYCLEIISERFDRLTYEKKQKVLIHELLHIPQNFSGTLLSHRRLKGRRFEDNVERIFNNLKSRT